MAYATKQDLIDRYSEEELAERTNRDGGDTVVDAVVEAALQSADSLIDLHLRGRYRVPLTGTIPREIVDIACPIARHALWTGQVSEAVRDAYDDAIKSLEKIASGKVQLDIEAPAAAERGIQFYSEPSPITPADLKGYIG
ncbi:MAG: DUF1320 domain-containing protein [Alphaproteobacteria bacterium]|nr:DUF1320 domain-containing protein [Alphaproteobacteria bacterium]